MKTQKIGKDTEQRCYAQRAAAGIRTETDMTKAYAKFLAAAILLTALTGCGRRPEVDTAVDTETDTGTETSVGMPETDMNTDMQDPNGENMSDGGMVMTQDTDPVDSVRNADDAVRFISNNLYSLCSEVLPMAVETRALDLSDADAVHYNTGLSATDGITDIILSESAVGSFAYSLVYVRTDGTNTDAIHQSLKDSIDPRKWVCVEAEAMNTVQLDNDICVVMGSAEQVDTISASLQEAANGVFTEVGEVNTVL